jgi:hypothetical protein
MQYIASKRAPDESTHHPVMGPMAFRRLSTSAALICLALALVWVAAPQFLLTMWGVSSPEAAQLVGRRASALFLGIAVAFFVSRHSPPSPARSALLKGMAASCFALGALGIAEWTAGHAHHGILTAVGMEVLLGAGLTLAVVRGG